MSATTIQWTHPPGYRGESWNGVRGCSRTVAKGAGGRSECGDATGGGCYAERQGARGCGEGGAYDGLVRLTGKGPRWTGKVIVVDNKLLDPMRAREPRCYFVASTSDPFHAQVSDATRDQMFAAMALAQRHRYILLTKHGADNGSLRRYMLDPRTPERIADVVVNYGRAWGSRLLPSMVAWTVAALRQRSPKMWPIPGLILGVSAGLKQSVIHRVPELLAVPAWRRVVSVEPLLEDVVEPLARFMPAWRCNACDHFMLGRGLSGAAVDEGEAEPCCSRCSSLDVRTVGLDWIIVGGESGPGSRPCELTAAARIAQECDAAGVAYFFKQAGRNPVINGRELPMLIDGHGGDLEELRPVLVDAAPADFPIDSLIRREYPSLNLDV